MTHGSGDMQQRLAALHQQTEEHRQHTAEQVAQARNELRQRTEAEHDGSTRNHRGSDMDTSPVGGVPGG